MSNEQTADLKKNETGEMIKNALILFVITLIAGVLLGLVYQITKEPIAYQNALKVEKANKAVFASASSFGQDNIVDSSKASEVLGTSADYSGVTIESVIEAYDGSGNVIGYIVQITSKGYNDDIEFSMGITTDGVLNGISLISISETPGLGMNAEKVLVPQYSVDGGIDATVTYSVVKDGTGKSSLNDTSIEAISGATITSKAVTNGVNAGLLYYTNVLEGGQ
ncbi:FMN-binding protein [Butyrivibrio fibrisolvens]|jgi:electron transport complex protein RnfG|uniref:Ion-translocating oxidoreductase complex subunit G n=1 Tax=Butyrivibrio fibrisolvens TaxID=831 RepID=A0A1H9ML80_BUTFI|nr:MULTISPECIES: FMN-binding protein [Butyrivibrio]MBQ1459031.1 FMN-binding protein [Butyrivibrio sp.]MCR4634923.1 FMN-binding protein [Butyrivibrio sp.]SER24215.1 electron transport complex protein RnfG [Butyrivibrio fibrisolvens]